MKKILVPIDGSSASLKAVQSAIDLAKKFGSSITVVTVVREAVGYGNTFGSIVLANTTEIQKLNEKNHLDARRMLDKVVSEIIPKDIKADAEVLNGAEPADEIVAAAEDGNFDLIVMGRRGLSKVHRLFVGSVTQRVLAETPCAVFVIKEEDEA